MNFGKRLFGTLAALALSAPAFATNITINPDGAWNPFDVDDVIALTPGSTEWIDATTGLSGYHGDGSKISFSITLSSAAYLTVVDAGYAGDTFTVFDNTVALGTTSPAVNSYPNTIGTNFNAALLNPNYSQGVFLLGAGTHSITGELLASAVDGSLVPFNATVGALKVAPVPLPAGLWLLGSACVGLFARTRRA